MKPLIIGVPGLMGGPEDFIPFIEPISEKFQFVQYDPNANRRSAGLSSLDEVTMKEISYDGEALDLLKLIQDRGAQGAYFLGISIGGKVVIDFASRYPDYFLGAVITDVGPSPFEESEHFKLINDIVKKTDMNLPWPEMRNHLREVIPDRNLRSLIQTQIAYPNRQPPAIWKTGMKNFGAMLERQKIGDQFESLDKVSFRLASAGRFVNILKASQMSGIPEQDMPRIQSILCVKVSFVEGTHHLHVQNKDLIIQTVLKMV